jgi:hypothetical protein
VAGIPRHLLEKYFGREPRLLRAFEAQSIAVEATADGLRTTATATENLQDATVIVLSPNGAFTNERQLVLGQGLSAVDDGARLTIRTSQSVPLVNGGFTVNFTVGGNAAILLPLTGTMATTEGVETLSGKTLAAPIVSGLGNYADDAAAASGGVPVGGMYRNGSHLMVRVA